MFPGMGSPEGSRDSSIDSPVDRSSMSPDLEIPLFVGLRVRFPVERLYPPLVGVRGDSGRPTLLAMRTLRRSPIGATFGGSA
jgi:hypothetical protein